MLEQEVIREVHSVLDLFGVFHWRNNTGQHGHVKYGFPGSPDFICILNGGTFLGVECKAPGGRMSAEQKAFQGACKELGAGYCVVTSGAEVIAYLAELAQNGKTNTNHVTEKWIDDAPEGLH